MQSFPRANALFLGAVCSLAFALINTTPAEETVPTAAVATVRPAEWAQPVQAQGVPNLHEVTDNRVVVCGWSKEKAAREMTEGGFGFHSVWTDIVPFLNGLDIGKLRKEAGVSPP